MLSEELKGLRAELESEDSLEVLCFHEGAVSATLGIKDGPVTAPILEYMITGDRSLIIEGLSPITWEDINFGDGSVTVMRNGEIAIYKTSKSLKEKR